MEQVLNCCKEPRSRKEIQEFIGINDRKYFTDSILKPLIEDGLLKRTIPDKPTSPNQKYHTNR